MKSEEKERFRELLFTLGITQKTAAEIMEMDESYMSRMLSEESEIKVSNKKLHKLKAKYPRINIEWVKSGKGEMLIGVGVSEDTTEYSTKQEIEIEELKKEKAKLIDIIHDLVKQIDKN